MDVIRSDAPFMIARPVRFSNQIRARASLAPPKIRPRVTCQYANPIVMKNVAVLVSVTKNPTRFTVTYFESYLSGRS